MQVNKKKKIVYFLSGRYIPPHLRNKDASKNGMLCWFTFQTVGQMHANSANIYNLHYEFWPFELL